VSAVLFEEETASSNFTWLQLPLASGRHAVSQIERLETLVEAQQQQQLTDSNEESSSSKDERLHGGFVWEVYVPTYSYKYNVTAWFLKNKQRPRLRGNQGDGCDYAKQVPSTLSLELVDRVMTRVQSMYPATTTWAHFHIRRGDTKKVCNTSLPAINDFLSCSFLMNRSPDVHCHFGKNITFLITSDEWWKQCYRSSICEIVENGFGYGCVDLDQTIQSVLEDYLAERREEDDSMDPLNNNMFLYHLSTLIKLDPRIKIFLEKRREGLCCRDCVDVVREFANAPAAAAAHGSQGKIGHDARSSSGNPQDTATSPRTIGRGWELSDTIQKYEACSSS
jgi:hypothetical protein